MRPVSLKFYDVGKRWFDGKKINATYSKGDFPHLYKEAEAGGVWRDRREDDSDYGVESDSD